MNATRFTVLAALVLIISSACKSQIPDGKATHPVSEVDLPRTFYGLELGKTTPNPKAHGSCQTFEESREGFGMMTDYVTPLDPEFSEFQSALSNLNAQVENCEISGSEFSTRYLAFVDGKLVAIWSLYTDDISDKVSFKDLISKAQAKYGAHFQTASQEFSSDEASQIARWDDPNTAVLLVSWYVMRPTHSIVIYDRGLLTRTRASHRAASDKALGQVKF